jgi:biopolymer transport protein ExbD
MMKRNLIILMAAGVAACMPSGKDPNASGAGPAPDATLAIAATADGGCAARWNGAAATADQVRAQGRALVQASIAEVGGRNNMTEETMPDIRVEAAAQVRWQCAAPLLAALRQAGLARIKLAADAAGPAVPASFPLEGLPASLHFVTVGAGGRLTWNRVAIDTARLDQSLASIGSPPGEPPEDGGPPPGEVLLTPDADADAGAVLGVLRAMARYSVEPVVTVEPGSPAEAPTP